MHRFATALLLAAIAIPTFGGEAQAYDASKTHRWLTRQAVELLVASHPGEYDELLEYIDQIVEGAYHEDDMYTDGDQDPSTLRVMRHFYHAPDRAGLSFGDHGEFPNSYEWNGIQSEQNEWDYHDGLLAYQRGDYASAFFIAGHTLHLIEDLTVPAHSHLDDHGPPFGDNYEQYCKSQTDSAKEGRLPTVIPGTPLPQFASLAEAFQTTANASYYRNSYPGYLSDEGDAVGVIKEMFPAISQSWLSGEWTIPGVGTLGADFVEEAPGYYYFSKNEVPSPVDVVDYDPLRPHDRVYGPVADDGRMVERMAEDLVPVAILHSAAVLKLFVDQARNLPPIGDPIDMPLAEDEEQAVGCSASSSQSGLLGSLLFVLLLVVRQKNRRKHKRGRSQASEENQCQ